MSALIVKLPVSGRKVAEGVVVDVADVRRTLGLSRERMAVAFGIRRSDLEDWERGKGQPTGLVKMLFVVAAREPEAVRRTLASMGLCESEGK